MIPSSPHTLDAHDRRWERVTGEPQRFVMRGLWWLGLYPCVQADGGTVTLYDVELPEPLVEDDDEPTFPETYHIGCVEGGLADLWAADGEATWALTAWAAYLETEAALLAWLQHRGSGPLTHGLGWSA